MPPGISSGCDVYPCPSSSPHRAAWRPPRRATLAAPLGEELVRASAIAILQQEMQMQMRACVRGLARRATRKQGKVAMAAAQAQEKEAGQEMLRVLQSTQVQQLAQNKGRLIEVPYSATVSDALNAMLAHNVMAVPVAAPPGHWIGAGGTMIMESDRVTGEVRKQYIGMVSVFDILIHLCDTRFDPDVETRLVRPMTTVIGHTLEGLSMWTISPSTTVYEAMEPMSKGIHRALVPVVSRMEHGAGVELTEFSPGYHMLTQTDLVRFLLDHDAELGGFLSSHSVSQVGAVHDDIAAVPGNFDLLRAVFHLWNNGMTAVAVLEPAPEGVEPEFASGQGKKALCSFSAGDLRACAAETLRLWCNRPLLEFLQRAEVAKRYGLGAAAMQEGKLLDAAAMPKPLVACSPDATLAEAMRKALESKVHRVWITDEEGLLLGVVHFSDILRVVREHARESRQQ